MPHRSKKVTNHPVVNRELTIDELKAALSKEKEKNRLLHIELRCVSAAGGPTSAAGLPTSAPGLARICGAHVRLAGAYERRLIQTLGSRRDRRCLQVYGAEHALRVAGVWPRLAPRSREGMETGEPTRK